MTSPRHPNARDATLLIVDDDDIDAMSVQRSLARTHFANPVRRARDGQEALDMLLGRLVPEPWLILLDLNMPRMSGLECLRRIRADPAISATVVFVLTTSKADADMAAAYREHIAGYIVKQWRFDNDESFGCLLKQYGTLVDLPRAAAVPAP